MTDSPKQVIIFSSQSGVNIKECLERIYTSLDIALKNRTQMISLERDSIGDLIRNSVLASDFLEDMVTKDYEKAIENINDSNKDIFFAHFHSCFWKKSTGFTLIDRLYSIFNKNLKTQVKCVITLIDDFYNVFIRISDHYQQNGINEKFTPLDILSWRSMEIMLARLFANSLNVPHYVISVNHSLSLIRNLLFREHVPVYAGHPISEIRSYTAEKKNDLIDFVNDKFLLPLHRDGKLALFIPDTIDERPIFQLIATPGASTTYANLLSAIWPRIWLGAVDNAIADAPQKDTGEKFFPEFLSFLTNNQVALLDVVNGQITDRDYRLVNQSDAFAFILIKETPNSDGVKNELIYARSVYKHTHFFNPQCLESGKETSLPSPNWASGVSGTHKDIDFLIKTLHKYKTEALVK